VELTETAELILDVAQELAQTRGYNAFSYRDLAGRVGITTASIHYHFPTKGDLGRALVTRYGASVAGAVADLERRTPDALARLRGYAALLEDVLAPPGTGVTGGGRVCLGGMLASEYPTLPLEVQSAVRGFVEDNVRWLARVLAEGRAAGSLAFPGTPEAAATALFSALEGAMLVSRTAGDVGRYRAASAWLLSALTPPA
jgi:TetR/AcrR family transcriptional regulator, transcriptional repressor for nem operon